MSNRKLPITLAVVVAIPLIGVLAGKLVGTSRPSPATTPREHAIVWALDRAAMFGNEGMIAPFVMSYHVTEMQKLSQPCRYPPPGDEPWRGEEQYRTIVQSHLVFGIPFQRYAVTCELIERL